MDYQCVSLLVGSRVMFLEHRKLIPGPLERLRPKDITQKFVLLFNLTIDRTTGRIFIKELLKKDNTKEKQLLYPLQQLESRTNVSCVQSQKLN